MASGDQPTGPAIIMSEFGATNSVPLAGFDVEWAGLSTVGWIYWAWKYYDDPTGSSAEGLELPDGTYSPIVTVLSRTYPQAVAGVANAVLFNPFTVCLLHGLHAERLGPRPNHHQRGRVPALPERLVRCGQGRQDRLVARSDASAGADGGHAGRGLRLGDTGRLPLVFLICGSTGRIGAASHVGEKRQLTARAPTWSNGWPAHRRAEEASP